MRAEPVLAVLFLIAFFLPWIDAVESFSGFQILKFYLDQTSGTEAMLPPLEGDGAWLLYVFYAIPVGGVLTLIFGLVNILPRLFALLTGLAPWVLLVYVLANSPIKLGDLTQIFGIGAYATLVVGLLLIMAGLGLFRSRAARA